MPDTYLKTDVLYGWDTEKPKRRVHIVKGGRKPFCGLDKSDVPPRLRMLSGSPPSGRKICRMCQVNFNKERRKPE